MKIGGVIGKPSNIVHSSIIWWLTWKTQYCVVVVLYMMPYKLSCIVKTTVE